MPAFLPGLELSRLFFAEAVRPVLTARFPRLRYAAALLGGGSEVLGFDTPMSADHGWGPRVDLFLAEADFAAVRDAVDAALRRELPHRFRGHPTSFTPPDPADHGTQLLDPREGGEVHHRVALFTTRGFFLEYLAFDPADSARPIKPADWLTFPAQKLRTVAAGASSTTSLGSRRRAGGWRTTRTTSGSTCSRPGGRASGKRSI
jgi:hypothetical protein